MMGVVALALCIVITAGAYLAMSRDVFRCLVGVALVGNGINLLVFAAGRLTTATPPIVPDGQQVLLEAANPLPQALVLTAIVISFAFLCFSLVLVVRLIGRANSYDSAQMRAAEPVPTDPVKPAVEERA